MQRHGLLEEARRRGPRSGRLSVLIACVLGAGILLRISAAVLRPLAFAVAGNGAAPAAPQRAAVDSSLGGDDLGRRGALLAAGVSSSVVAPPLVRAETASAGNGDPKVTARCELEFRIGADKTRPLQRVVIGLFGGEAPDHARAFQQACSGTYTGEAGLRANYRLSDVRSVSKDRFIWMADFSDGNYRFKKVRKSKYKEEELKLPLAGEDTLTNETNALRNDKIGRVSMLKGGGTFNFFISPVASAPWIDAESVVVGQVLEGLDVIDEINNVPTVMKGSVTNAIGADPIKDQYRQAPQAKIRVFKAQVL